MTNAVRKAEEKKSFRLPINTTESLLTMGYLKLAERNKEADKRKNELVLISNQQKTQNTTQHVPLKQKYRTLKKKQLLFVLNDILRTHPTKQSEIPCCFYKAKCNRPLVLSDQRYPGNNIILEKETPAVNMKNFSS